MYASGFASVYDRLMADFDYPAWASHYLALAGSPKTVAECGCGTGSISLPLALQGVRVTGVDLSPDMLRVASDKARSAGVSIPFVCQDMRSLALPRPVEAVFAPCDGVNYLLSDADVGLFFSAAHRALKPGGRLVFDVSTPEKLARMADAPYYEDLDDLTYLWVNRWSDDLLHMALTFFVRQGGGLYKRFDESQTQRGHTAASLLRLLALEGFDDLHIYGERTLRPPQPGDARWHVVAVKPKRTGDEQHG